MKTDILDYLFSSLSILFLLAFTYLITQLISKAMVSYVSDYHAIVTVIFFIFIYGSLTAIFLRIISFIFPFKGGSHSMGDSQFVLWKLHAVVGELGRLALILFFPVFLRPIYYTLLGANIGKQTAIGGKIVDPCLTKIEDYAVLGQDSVITAHAITYDRFIIAPVIVRKRATVGVSAVIMPGVEIGENSIVAPGSVVPMNTKIPPNEVWGGIPAKKIKDIDASDVRS